MLAAVSLSTRNKRASILHSCSSSSLYINGFHFRTPKNEGGTTLEQRNYFSEKPCYKLPIQGCVASYWYCYTGWCQVFSKRLHESPRVPLPPLQPRARVLRNLSDMDFPKVGNNESVDSDFLSRHMSHLTQVYYSRRLESTDSSVETWKSSDLRRLSPSLLPTLHMTIHLFSWLFWSLQAIWHT